ncbi:hypothetical protein PHISCL_01385 [Aspergillus sclerotialis]|uniref:Uncharacterized protein n=1 Tax=Aspergillus sclerotialis TaxID=2070753 RepID=A0A3A2ZTC3_9EURO|nr:hypothetical protein PHISCL_01385 [Aspergillus sclerotialis]
MNWQKNIRMMHHISEFLDLDSTKSNLVAELISLIDAIREGLQQIDEEFRVPDAQINILFLTKLKSRPEWNEWATAMMRDPRLNTPDPENRMTFQTLANLAIEQEKIIQQREHSDNSMVEPPGTLLPTLSALTQDDINEFVMRKMGHEKLGHCAKGHFKRPSQEEINEYVVQQMRKEQERKTRIRCQSQPESRSQCHDQRLLHPRCGFCGDPHHRLSHCWRRWRVAAEEPQANFMPKRVEFRTEAPGQPPMYRTGFTLF